MLSGGVGISPFRGMIRYVSDKRLELPIILIHSNRVPEEIPFGNELGTLLSRIGNSKVIHTITSPKESGVAWDGRQGRINAELIREEVKAVTNLCFYIAGQPAFANSMATLLQRELGVPSREIRQETFRGY